MLETSSLDEAQKNRRAGQGIGAHLRRALLWFKWREWLPAATQAFSSQFQPTHLYWRWIMVQLLHLVLECNAGLVRILPCMADLFWTLESEECVCLGWTQNRPFASFFEPILNSTQTCLVHPDCRWASLLKFHFPNTWRMFDRHVDLIRT